ncbi:MAG TPA: HEAT repeat domain-containing protein, partial [Gemmataceae bacterium]|nr:HEAT repeat domain-containing protein [Gemmataceae bacterium]
MMNCGRFLAFFGIICFGVGIIHWPQDSRGEQTTTVQWIWFNEGDPTQAAPAETRYFRRVFVIDRPVQKVVDEGTLDITADNSFTVWVNDNEVGKGDKWERIYRFDVTKLLRHGENVIAVEGKNTDGPAGLMVRLAFVPNGQDRRAVVSDSLWKSSKTAAEGWQKLGFKEEGWSSVKVLGPYGRTGPWKNQTWDAGSGDDRFTVPSGFKVELAVKRPADDSNFSLVNLTFDAKGRLLVSREGGPVLLCTKPDKNGMLQSVKPYCEQVKNCQGMCWVNDALLLVGDGPQGTGLYRCRDTNGRDKIDEVKLLHKFQGGMGEHGPHAIIHGPDNWLYVVIGNHAWAHPDKLAANSPLTRWPTGGMGPDQGKPGTTEDVLLKRLNDSRGHAADILAPGGTIWRLDHEGKNMSLVTAGFRNHFDAAFSPSGELFTFDSDMEWDEALPWYRGIRVCHCPPGADFVWRTGAANTPDYYIDSLPPTLDVGRGSPVGVEFYDHVAFPEKYHGALFLADWSMGLIYAAHLERNGASYKAKLEKFCQGAPMNVTDIAVGPDGALYFTMGGRGSQGDVYRIVYESYRAKKGPDAPTPAVMQPLSAWSRAYLAKVMKGKTPEKAAVPGSAWMTAAFTAAMVHDLDSKKARTLIMYLNARQSLGALTEDELLEFLAATEDEDAAAYADLRAHIVHLLGVNRYEEGQEPIVGCFKDKDALVRRRACEALIRAGFEPPVDAIWPLLVDKDRFVRTAARLVLQRID